MPIDNNEIHLLGYNVKNVPISDVVWLNKEINLIFDLKIKDNPFPYSAITDIDFFTHIDNQAFEKESARSFASLIIKDSAICLSYNDFNLNQPEFFKILDIDDQWHKFEITISKENLWCPNKKCEFEDCLHLDAELIEDDLIGWKEGVLKRHRRVSIKIDQLNLFNFNYLTGAKYTVVSFGNNNINLIKDPHLNLMVLKSYLRGESSMILKNIYLTTDDDEVEFNMKSKITD